MLGLAWRVPKQNIWSHRNFRDKQVQGSFERTPGYGKDTEIRIQTTQRPRGMRESKRE